MGHSAEKEQETDSATTSNGQCEDNMDGFASQALTGQGAAVNGELLQGPGDTTGVVLSCLWALLIAH